METRHAAASIVSSLALLALFLGPEPAAAQATGSTGAGVSQAGADTPEPRRHAFHARIGRFAPAGVLATVQDGDHLMELSFGGTRSQGAGAAVRLSPGFELRGSVDFVRPELVARTLDCPDTFVRCEWRLPTKLALVSTDVVYRPGSDRARLRPYALAGAALVRRSVENLGCMPGGSPSAPSCFIAEGFSGGTQTDAAVRGGLGAEVRIGGGSLTAGGGALTIETVASAARMEPTKSTSLLPGTVTSRAVTTTVGLRLPFGR